MSEYLRYRDHSSRLIRRGRSLEDSGPDGRHGDDVGYALTSTHTLKARPRRGASDRWPRQRRLRGHNPPVISTVRALGPRRAVVIGVGQK